jgi:D-alanyl-D-alanine carboxypeptidase
MRHLHWFVVSLALCACIGDESDHLCQARGERLQTGLDALRTSPHVVLAIRDEQCGAHTYVSGDRATVKPDSLFRIASVTKTYVSALVLTLAQDGELDLEDAASAYIGDFPDLDGVTIRMLLNHTSGLFDYTEDATFWSEPTRKWEPQEIVDFALTHEPYFAPGEGFHYSNTNYILLGMLGEQITGQPIGQLLRERLFEPAHLRETFLDGEEPIRGTLAPGYDADLNEVTYILDPSAPWAAGAMVASAADVALWMETLYGSDLILDDASQALLRQDALAPEGVAGYGLGVMLLPPENTGGAGPALGHGGGIPGYETLGFYFPEKALTLVAIVNKDASVEAHSSANDVVVMALQTLALDWDANIASVAPQAPAGGP